MGCRGTDSELDAMGQGTDEADGSSHAQPDAMMGVAGQMMQRYQFDRIFSEMEKEFGKLDTYADETYVTVMFPIEGNALKVHRTYPTANSRRFKEALALVLFDINSSVLRPEAIPVLNDAALFLRENPDVKVIVEGHTDNTGSDRINEPLSERRARAVAEYLIRRGVEADRVKAVGFGSTRPKTTNDTALGRQLNRRMEFVFDIQ